MRRKIAIVNQKGGVGKTTTAVNVSASLSLLNNKILLIDLDPQANATSGLGINANSFEKTIYDVLIGDVELKSIIKKTEIDGLEVAPANYELTGATVELNQLERKEYLLRDVIDNVRNLYDYILIDCPPSLGYLTLNGLVAADSVIIPMQCEYYALEGIAQLINTLNKVKENLNKSLYIEGILLTMYDPDTSLSKEVANEVNEHFKGDVFKTKILRDIRLGEAPSFGMPIILYNFISKGATSYMELAKEVIKHE